MRERFPYTVQTPRSNHTLTSSAVDWCNNNAGVVYMDWDALYNLDKEDIIIWYFKYKSTATQFMLTFG